MSKKNFILGVAHVPENPTIHKGSVQECPIEYAKPTNWERVDETLDFPKGDPKEHVSPNTTIEDYRPPNAPPTCEGCEE